MVDFSGGPGGSAVGDIPAVLPQLGPLNQDRDLVFIDQRGYRRLERAQLPFPQASQQALDEVLARCARNPTCHDAFPRLGTEWMTLRASLARNPVTVPAALSPADT